MKTNAMPNVKLLKGNRLITIVTLFLKVKFMYQVQHLQHCDKARTYKIHLTVEIPFIL